MRLSRDVESTVIRYEIVGFWQNAFVRAKTSRRSCLANIGKSRRVFNQPINRVFGFDPLAAISKGVFPAKLLAVNRRLHIVLCGFFNPKS